MRRPGAKAPGRFSWQGEKIPSGYDQTVLDQAGQRPGPLHLVAPDDVEALPGDRAGRVPPHLEEQAADVAVGAGVALVPMPGNASSSSRSDGTCPPWEATIATAQACSRIARRG